MAYSGSLCFGDQLESKWGKGMNYLPGASSKDYLQVRISTNGIPTDAFFAPVGTGAIASRTFEAGQIAPEARIPVVASFATTDARASIVRSFETGTDSVVKHCLSTVHGGNCQGMFEGSIRSTSGLVKPDLANNVGRCSR